MATRRFCDICEKEKPIVAVVQVCDGQNPHNGGSETRRADCCSDCLRFFEVLVPKKALEFHDLQVAAVNCARGPL